MVKSISTIYIDSLILESAKSNNLPISQICEEALKLSLNVGVNSGSVEGALSNFLNHQAEKNKDIQIIKKLALKRDERFNEGLRIFMKKYTLDMNETLKVCGV